MLADILDKFTTPYNNDKVISLLEKIKNFEVNKIEDITNYLISHKGHAVLNESYTPIEIKLIEKAIGEIN